MADANITELRPGRISDPTNALRQRRHRKRKARSTVTARAPRTQIAYVEKLNDIKPDVTVSVGRRNVVDVTAYVAAIALAEAAACFSIRGMVVLFPGAPMSVVGMGIAMEGAKLVTADGSPADGASRPGYGVSYSRCSLLGLPSSTPQACTRNSWPPMWGERGAAQSAIEAQEAALAARIEVAATASPTLTGD